MLPTLWFCILSGMLAVYVVLDGFDLGAGIVHLGLTRTESERRAVFQAIGPVWDGNEVWLIAGGGTLYFAFPRLYAAAFEGFYLPLMIVLWLLILRGISIEFRNHIDNAVWRPIWDVVFSGSSALLAIFLGAALGNVVRGVPLDASGGFFLPLWTSFEPGPNPGILDWYTVLVGAYAYLALAMHGTLYLYLKTEGVLHRRAALLARRAWYFVAALTVPVTLISFRIQPHIQESFAAFPAGYAFPVLACIGLAGVYIYLNREDELKAFLASCFYLLAMLASVVCGLLPLVLPGTSPQYSLTVTNASAAESGLRIGLLWFMPGAALAVFYFVFLYRKFAGKVPVGSPQ